MAQIKTSTDKYNYHCTNNERSHNITNDMIKMITSTYVQMNTKQLISTFPMYLIMIIISYIAELADAHFITGLLNHANEISTKRNDKFFVPYLDNINEYFSKFAVCSYKAYLLTFLKNDRWECNHCGEMNKYFNKLCDSCFANYPHSYYPAFRWTLQIASITMNGCIKVSMKGINEFDRSIINIWSSELFAFGILIHKQTIFTTEDEQDDTGCLLSKTSCTQVKIAQGDIIQIGINHDKLIIIIRASNNNIKTTFKWIIPTIKYRLYVYTSDSQNIVRMMNFKQIK